MTAERTPHTPHLERAWAVLAPGFGATASHTHSLQQTSSARKDWAATGQWDEQQPNQLGGHCARPGHPNNSQSPGKPHARHFILPIQGLPNPSAFAKAYFPSIAHKSLSYSKAQSDTDLLIKGSKINLAWIITKQLWPFPSYRKMLQHQSEELLWSDCVSANSCVEILTPMWWGLEVEALGGDSDMRVEPQGLVPYKSDPRKSSCSFYHGKTHWEVCNLEGGPHVTFCTLISDFQPPELWD